MKRDTKILLELLFQMKKIRMVENAIAQRYRESKMRCPTHLCIGQEAIAAAVGSALTKEDFVVSTHRAHGHYLAKGGSLKRMIAEIYGKSTGCSSGKGGSMHLIDENAGFMGSTAIVGGTIPVGVGLGLSIQLKKTDQISCIFLGDGATEEGVFYEALNFAVLKNLPVLFICENNFHSVYSSLTVRQPRGRSIARLAGQIGCISEDGDGNDVLDVYSKVEDAAKAIRQKKGPRFFEFTTYRWREHCGPNFDNDLGYRTQEEYLDWKKRDPVLLFETKLLNEKVILQKDIQAIEKKIQYEIDEAFAYAEQSPFPPPQEAFKGLYKIKEQVNDAVADLC